MSALLRAEQLTKAFGSTQAVAGISFDIAPGRCTALLGPNGAGKTTTIRMLAGLLQPTGGKLSYAGVKPGQSPNSLLGYLPQAPSFYGWMTGREYAVYAARLCGLSAAEARSQADALLERVGLSAAANRAISGYSGGMKQRLGLAQALVHRPKLLILDEPVSALDPLGRHEVLMLLRELKQETTVLFSTHVLHDAEQLCDDVLIIRNGEMALQGSIEEIKNNHRMSVITLHIEGDDHSKQWCVSYQGGAYVKELRRIEKGIELVVTDMELARRELLGQLAEDGIRVAKLEFGHSTLEDLFMKVVSG
ncbi:ABC transporter ATP-binding protein [Paenibacillus radicis (ex Gao et al. 2016)]|uniref:ABC transporter ATP-binding protein YxlF n=1 Tax=Paenibacillus radicis (ex Gao et al. 2016) TaxID=1737354 RepID=A0A917M6W8_9BACL|nr:ABC transporter ATP-binding protein [Paenibacillus radicis (ex Gao et al. 2016)]GGG81261.1 putative ABC transporter ATP-binding protein YxlF [Paenibacillus radicis (ex Gao et al. 2016)]